MPLPLHRVLFSLLLSFFLSGYLSAQTSRSADSGKDSLSAYIQMKYGLDQELFNGFQYYKLFVKYKGDPFYPEDSFYEGSVSKKGVEYENVRLKYNSYSHFLVLEYKDFEGRYNQIRLDNAQIDSFRLGAFSFQKLSLLGEEPLFYQVINSGPVTCYIHWAKDIHATSDDLQYSYEYTKPFGTNYVSYQGEIQTFTNRKSFLSSFPESMQAEIKKYFRLQRLSFREADPGDIQNLLIHISQLEETISEH
jgi:hypothetical protein